MIDAVKISEIIRDVAEEEILPRFKNLRREQIREKKPNQLVTEADTEAERVLSRRLQDIIPGMVVGEEGVESDSSVLGALARDGIVWVIDPVDGTANFANNNPRFAVIVALVVDGVTRMGWIHDPVPNRTVVAEQGQGAWQDGTRLKVAAELPLSQMTGSIKRTGRVAEQALHIARRGSAAHDYLDLATGRQHFAHFRRLMPWDHAAGVLIHQEAGGFAMMLNNSPYTPILHADGQLLLTPGEQSWREISALMD
jgi:fructose-1,6-bisphosphatase/inositol monophosphatase family enzyme